MKKILKGRVNKVHLFYFLDFTVIFVIFLVLAYLNTQIKKQISELDVYVSPQAFTPDKYPVITNRYDPPVSALGAIVIDMNSQVPLYARNEKLRLPPASTTKIMTALVALDYYKPRDILTINQEKVEGSVLGLKTRESLYFEDLFYAMLLPSANDATLAIAQDYPGGESAFVAKMNEKAKEFGLLNTYFADPIGLLDESDFTTPQDLARLASIALKNPIFAKAVSTKKRQITSLGGNSYQLFNLNRLLDLPGINGVKTGFTEGAGQVLVTSRQIENKKQDLIIVVMQSQDRFADTEIILNYLNNNISYLSIHP